MPLLQALYRAPWLWEADTIFLRETAWYSASTVIPETRRLIMALMAQVEGEQLGRALLTRLAPGGKMLPEEQALSALSPPYWGRYHLVLQTQPAAFWRCEEERVHMAGGEAWYVCPGGEQDVYWEVPWDEEIDRIHLLVDIHTAQEGQGGERAEHDWKMDWNTR